MTKRQEWLIATLRAAKGAWLSELEICDAMINDIIDGKFPKGEEYTWHGNNHKGSQCPAIWDDMDKINQDFDSDAIILTKDRCFAIAVSKQDVDEMLLKPLLRKSMHAFKRFWNIKDKTDMNFQGRLTFNNDEIVFINIFKEYMKGSL